MKKSISILLSFVLLLTMFSTVAFAQEEGELLYTDWQMSDDYTKITINGKTYDNYIFIFRDGDQVRVFNPASLYLFYPSLQKKITPEKYFTERMEIEVSNVLDGMETIFPVRELLYVNGKPVQDSEFMDEYIDIFERRHEFCRPNVDKDTLINFLSDKNNSGYAEKVFREKKDISQAKKEWDIKEVPIISDNLYLYRDYQEFVKKGGWEHAEQETILSTCQEYINGKPLKDLEREMPINPPADNNKTTVVLYLKNKAINITQNGVSNNIILDVAPYCPVGTTLVPIRGVLEAFGADIKWLSDTRQVKVTKGDMNILLTIDSKIALVNGEKATLLEPAQILNGRTMIPLRFISENLGYDVKWFGDEQKIVISN